MKIFIVFVILCIIAVMSFGMWYFFVGRTSMTPSEKYNSLFEMLEGHYFENLAPIGIRLDKRKTDDVDSIVVLVYKGEEVEHYFIKGKRNAPSK